jgi:hypothetical protein
MNLARAGKCCSPHFMCTADRGLFGSTHSARSSAKLNLSNQFSNFGVVSEDDPISGDVVFASLLANK